jgi:hypothetical protein
LLNESNSKHKETIDSLFVEKRRILFIDLSFNRNKKLLNQSIRFGALLYFREPIVVIYKIAFQITCRSQLNKHFGIN